MNTTILIILGILVVVLAEVTYIIMKLPRSSLKTKRRAVLVDTSVLMDGRIISIAQTGFIGDTLVIPRSVVGELQLVADNSDNEKRARARRGLDVVAELQALANVDVELLQDSVNAREGVDNRLIELAKQHHALIMTIDFNLSKVAHVEGIAVLNINDLSQSIRMAHLPGEHLMIELVQNGQDSHQAIGYLEDGTMVVVEQARAHVGKTIAVEIIRSLQTSAGKMMFAKRVGNNDSTPTRRNENGGKRTQQHQHSAQPEGQKRASSRSGTNQKFSAQSSNQSSSQSAPSTQSSHTPAAPKRQKSQRSRQQTSKQREAALIDLANSQ